MDYDPDENEQAVLNVVREERRVNPLRVRKATGIRKQYVNDALNQLGKLRIVRRVNQGLYEYVPEEDDLDGAPGPSVELDAEDAATLADLLEELDHVIDAEYNTGSQDTRYWADRLREDITNA